MDNISTINADKDKMLTAREGVMTYIANLGSAWIKSNPLFFMALPDSDLYETNDVAQALTGLFKSTTTLNNFTTALLEIDENYSRALNLKELFETNKVFREKFYRFLVRHMCAVIAQGWTNPKLAYKHAYVSSKSALVLSVMKMTLSLTDIPSSGSITQNDINAVVQAILMRNISFKEWCQTYNNTAPFNFPTANTSNYVNIQINHANIWPL